MKATSKIIICVRVSMRHRFDLSVSFSFAKQEVKTGKNDRYKPKDSKQEKINQQQIQRSKSIPRNARLL